MAGRLVFAALVAVGNCLLIGCKSGGQGQLPGLADLFRPASTTTAPAGNATAEKPPDQPSPVLLQLSFEVLRTRVPRGTFSESGKIWNHLEEQILPAELTANLQRNGLRIARGRVTSWPPIKALLDAEKQVEAISNSMTLFNGLPLTVELDRQPHDQTLFLLRRDGSLGGVTLPASMNLLRIEYALSATRADAVLLDVMPEVRLDRAEANPNLWADRPVVAPSRVFRELAARLEVGPDEFVAVGPSPAAHRLHTMGSLLLCQEIDGQRHECMFFITPRVVRKELAPGTTTGGGLQPAPAP